MSEQDSIDDRETPRRRRRRSDHYDYDDRPPSIIDKTPPRTLGGWIAGGLGAFLGMIGGDTYIKAKLWEFDGKVDNLVRNDIMNRKTGVGAGLESAGSVAEHGASLGGLGPGISSHSLRLAHEYNLAESGAYPFARFVKRIGSWPITLGAAAAAGAVTMAAYFALVPKKKAVADDLSHVDMYAEFKKSMKRTGLADLHEQLKATENPEERKKLREDWEAKDYALTEQKYGKKYADQHKENMERAGRAGKDASASDILDELIAAGPEKKKEMMEFWEKKRADKISKAEGAEGKDWQASVASEKEPTRALE